MEQDLISSTNESAAEKSRKISMESLTSDSGTTSPALSDKQKDKENTNNSNNMSFAPALAEMEQTQHNSTKQNEVRRKSNRKTRQSYPTYQQQAFKPRQTSRNQQSFKVKSTTRLEKYKGKKHANTDNGNTDTFTSPPRKKVLIRKVQT